MEMFWIHIHFSCNRKYCLLNSVNTLVQLLLLTQNLSIKCGHTVNAIALKHLKFAKFLVCFSPGKQGHVEKSKLDFQWIKLKKTNLFILNDLIKLTLFPCYHAQISQFHLYNLEVISGTTRRKLISRAPKKLRWQVKQSPHSIEILAQFEYLFFSVSRSNWFLHTQLKIHPNFDLWLSYMFTFFSDVISLLNGIRLSMTLFRSIVTDIIKLLLLQSSNTTRCHSSRERT